MRERRHEPVAGRHLDGYRGFVFVEGAFAGTISPVLMNARSDGGVSGLGVDLYDEAEFGVTFTRYSGSDPLCCPHASTSLSYKIEMRGNRAIVAPAATQTTKNTF